MIRLHKSTLGLHAVAMNTVLMSLSQKSAFAPVIASRGGKQTGTRPMDSQA